MCTTYSLTTRTRYYTSHSHDVVSPRPLIRLRVVLRHRRKRGGAESSEGDKITAVLIWRLKKKGFSEEVVDFVKSKSSIVQLNELMESKGGKKKSSSSKSSLFYEAPLGYSIEDVRPHGGIKKFRSAAYSNCVRKPS
ncbi:hypothetical protein ACLB2K_062002 [Fragaria x ananassa]